MLLNASSTPFQFIVRTPTPTPAPTLTPTPSPTSTPTLTPTSTPSQTPSPKTETKFPTTQILVIIITILTGLGILAYSMKKRT